MLEAIAAANGGLPQVAAASMACWSTRSFRRNFKKLAGTTYRAKSLEIKLERARTLLDTTNWSVPAIAAHLDYSDRGKLEKAFKRLYGVTPTQYRARKSRSLRERAG